MPWRRLVVLSLLLVLTLPGCASRSLTSSERPTPLTASSVLDVPSWLSDVENYSNELSRLLESASALSDER